MRKRISFAAKDTFRSLSTRNFRLFFFGQLISQAGTWMQSVAVVWVALRLTDSGFALGLVVAAEFAPVLVIGAWGGVLADRVDRHRFLICTQAAFTVVAAGFAVMSFTNNESLPLIFLLATVFGCITALDNPARRSLVVDMVETPDVPNAVGLNSALMTGSRVVGPALAGAIITGFGPEWCFLVNVVSYFFVLGALLSMNRAELHAPPRVPKEKGQLVAGLRYTWRTPELRLPLVLLAVVGTMAFEFQVSLPLLTKRVFHGDAGTFTFLYSAMSVGAVVGSLMVARRTDADTRWLARSALMMAGFMGVLMFAPNEWFAAAAVVPVGLTSMFLITGSNAVIQLKGDPSMRGRVLALTAVVFLGSTPIGGPIVGWVADQFGARWGIGIGAICTAAAALWTFRQLNRLADDAVPLDDEVAVASEPAPAVALGH